VADRKLTLDQAFCLLRKLGTDDDFRTRFETKPAAALTEIGLSAEEVIQLNAFCLSPVVLADKSVFMKIVDTCDREALRSVTAMIVPNLRIAERRRAVESTSHAVQVSLH
jgi:putative modified peptide